MFRLLTNRRLWLVLLVVGALVAVAVWPRTVQVDMATVVRRGLLSTIDEEGETRVRQRFVLTAPVPGELLRIELEPGDPVTRGQQVATVRAAPPMPLDARTRAEAAAALDAARAAAGRVTADRDRARATLARLERQIVRTRQLTEAGAVSREDLETAETELQLARDAVTGAEFAVTQAGHEVQAAAARLDAGPTAARPRDEAVTAPVDGVVLKRYRESQAIVPAGEPLIEIGDPTSLEIVADLLSADAVAVRPGSDVLIEGWGGPGTLHGRLRRIEPAGFTKISALGVEEQRVNVIVDFVPSGGDPPPLGDGFRVDVRIVTWRGDDVLVVEPGALFRRGDAWAVFVVADGVARERTVDIDHRNDTAVEVVSGLAEGDRVVLYPPDTLADGDRVEPRRADGGTDPPQGGAPPALPAASDSSRPES